MSVTLFAASAIFSHFLSCKAEPDRDAARDQFPYRLLRPLPRRRPRSTPRRTRRGSRAAWRSSRESGSTSMASRKLPRPTRWMNSPIALAGLALLAPDVPDRLDDVLDLLVRRLHLDEGDEHRAQQRTLDDGSLGADQDGRRRVSLPGRSALGMTLMQCMQWRQSGCRWSAACRPSPCSWPGSCCRRRPGCPCRRRRTALTAAWSMRMSSRQVPMTDRSERAMEATQSLGQPENLNFHL